MEEIAANKVEITNAIAAHGKWKQRLIDAIENGNSEFTAQRLKVDNLCDFGNGFILYPPKKKNLRIGMRYKNFTLNFILKPPRFSNLL